jgi:serine/threonine protein kinase
MSERPPPQIFVSYSHHDAEWRQRLFTDHHVKSTLGVAQIWTDARLRAGDHWEAEIEQRLQGSAVAVLLVSEHFLSSAFIAEREYPKIIERARAGSLRVVWIPVNITRDRLTQQRAELAAMQGATGFSDTLPAEPQACPAETLQRLYLHIRDQLREAIDPYGADLARVVAGRYEVIDRIGEGNLASIYRARDPVLDRVVAIKVLKDANQRQAFMNDVADAVRISEEPNFMNVYDAAGEETTAYCVMQHVNGRSLRALLQELRSLQTAGERSSAMPVHTLRRVFVRLVAAIARAHARGITYGNLKPSNIILDEGDEPFILPMGRRRDRLREFSSVRALTERLHASKIAGVPPTESDLEDFTYLVPDHFSEQFEPIDPRLADQYMLGLLGYEMAAGCRPVLVADPAQLLQQGRAAFTDLPPVEQARPLCPRHIASLIARMASVDASRRYPRLEAVLQEADLQDDLDLVVARDSYRRCARQPDFDRVFFARFYEQFLRRCPEALEVRHAEGGGAAAVRLCAAARRRRRAERAQSHRRQPCDGPAAFLRALCGLAGTHRVRRSGAGAGGVRP